MKIKLFKIEEITGYKVKTNFTSLGLDIAERTGLCNITTDDKYAYFNYNFIEFDKSEIKNVYKDMYNAFKVTINKQDFVVIEDCFLQKFGKFLQVDVFKKLTRFGTLALSICLEKKLSYTFILAKSSRAKLKIKMIKGKPKESVANWLKEKLNIDLKGDTDCSDAIILGILGILENLDFRSQTDINKEKLKEK